MVANVAVIVEIFRLLVIPAADKKDDYGDDFRFVDWKHQQILRKKSTTQ